MELIGMIFSIAGAYMISKADQRSLYIAFYSFLISNLALLVFFAVNGKAPMVIQFTLFFCTAALGVIRCGEVANRKRDYILISLVVSSLIVILINSELGELTFKSLDTIASAIAIIGSFLLSSPVYERRQIAYVGFIVADILFVYIGVENGFLFFTLQSLFFVYTSTMGIINNRKLQANPS